MKISSTKIFPLIPNDLLDIHIFIVLKFNFNENYLTSNSKNTSYHIDKFDFVIFINNINIILGIYQVF